MKIGHNIKKARELRNYSQQYMADKLAMSVAGYSKIERDEVSVNLDKLQKIADALETNINKLIEFDERILLNNPTFAGDNYIGVNIGEITVNRYYQQKIEDIEERLRKIEGKNLNN